MPYFAKSDFRLGGANLYLPHSPLPHHHWKGLYHHLTRPSFRNPNIVNLGWTYCKDESSSPSDPSTRCVLYFRDLPRLNQTFHMGSPPPPVAHSASLPICLRVLTCALVSVSCPQKGVCVCAGCFCLPFHCVPLLRFFFRRRLSNRVQFLPGSLTGHQTTPFCGANLSINLACSRPKTQSLRPAT